MRRLLIAALSIATSSGAVLAQDLEAGEASFRKCAPCHSIGEDATNKVGPVLNGLDGRKAGAVEGFSYSDANRTPSPGMRSIQGVHQGPASKVPGTR
jgi:cytochrome c